MENHQRKTEYVEFWSLYERLNTLTEWGLLQSEYGCGKEVAAIREQMDRALTEAEKAMQGLTPDPVLKAQEPDEYEAIRALCPGGNTPARKIPDLEERMSGAVLGRFAGCTLGVPVEGWDIDRMKDLAAYTGMPFPPKDYWTQAETPWGVQYGRDQRVNYTRDGINGVPVDDDITYTILGLLILEKYGFDFTTADVGAYWKEYLPCACTAEKVALENLRAGIAAEHAAEKNNPYAQWIGADIRADGFAYAAAKNISP